MRALPKCRLFQALAAVFVVASLLTGHVPAAQAASAPAEAFVNNDIRSGMAILKNDALSPDQKNSQFQSFLLSVTDLKRIALFTLGPYAAAAAPADEDAFVTAFQNYALAVYRSYFQLYSGQNLSVTGSQIRAPDDVIVSTVMTDHSGGTPMQVDFRIRTDGARPEITDIGIAGIWLVLAQRDDFAGFLSQHKGDVKALTGHLIDVTAAYSRK